MRDKEEAAQEKAKAAAEVTFNYDLLNQFDPIRTPLGRKSFDNRRILTIYKTQTATFNFDDTIEEAPTVTNFDYYKRYIIPVV